MNYRGAYVLVGCPGIGINNGFDYYCGLQQQLTDDGGGDPLAAINLQLSVYNGVYTIISCTSPQITV